MVTGDDSLRRNKSVLGSILGSINRKKRVPEFDDTASMNSGRSRLSSMTVVDVSPSTTQHSLIPMPPPEEVEAAFTKMMEQLGGLKLGNTGGGKELGLAEKWQMVMSAQKMQQQKQAKSTQQIIEELKSGVLEEGILQAFRVSVTSEPIAWIREFIEHGGWKVFLQVARNVAFLSEYDPKREKLVAEVVKSYKAFSSCTVGLSQVVEDSESILVGALYLGDPNRLVRHAIVQLMAVFCLFKPPKSHQRLWGCLRQASKLLGENFVCERFLLRLVGDIDSLEGNEPSAQKTRYLLDSMILLNALISTSDGEGSLRERVLFRNQLYREPLKKVLTKLYEVKEVALERQLDFFFEDMRMDNEAIATEFEDYLKANPKLQAMTEEENLLMNSITKHLNFEPNTRRGYLRLLHSLIVDSCFSQIGLDHDIILSQQLPFFDLSPVLEKMEMKAGVEWKDKYEALERQKDLLEVSFAEQIGKLKREHEAHIQELTAKLEQEQKQNEVLSVQVEELRVKLEMEHKRKDSLLAPIPEEPRQSSDKSIVELNEQITTLTSKPSAPLEAKIPPPPPAPFLAAPPVPVAPIAPNAPLAPASPGAPPAPSSLSSASVPLPQSVNRKVPSCKMRQLQWQKIPDGRIPGSIWESMKDIKWEDKLDYASLAKGFCQVRKIQQSNEEEGKKSPRGFLSNKIQTNLGIALNRLKCPPVACKQALKQMDFTIFDEQITAELGKIEVTGKEREEIFKFLGEESDWSELPFAEQFLLHMYSLPFYENRLKCINYKNSFYEWYNDAKQECEEFLIATNKIPKSKSLQELLEGLLAVGNFMNSGSFRGNARGFELDALDFISGSKTNDGTSTLMEFIVQALDDHKVDSINALNDELSLVFKAAKTNIENLQEQLKDKKEAFQEIEAFLKESREGYLEGEDHLHAVLDPIYDKIGMELREADRLISSLPEAVHRLNSLLGHEGRTSEELCAILQRLVTDVERIRRDIQARKRKANEEQEKRNSKLAKIRKMLDELDEGNRQVVEGVIDQLRNF